MNAKTDRWESYTDKAGRRHWRWPAAAVEVTERDGELVAAQPRMSAVRPPSRQAPVLAAPLVRDE